MHWGRKWQPTPVFLPGESQGRGCLVGCRLWGRTESDTTEDLAATAAAAAEYVQNFTMYKGSLNTYQGTSNDDKIKITTNS